MNIRRGRWNWKYEGPALANGFRPESWMSNPSEFEFSFGAYGWTKVRVWANEGSYEDAFETAVEWLDDHAPEHLVSLTDDDLKESADELGLPWPVEFDTEAFEEIRTHAEADLIVIGHTTLKHGQYVLAYECQCQEITQ